MLDADALGDTLAGGRDTERTGKAGSEWFPVLDAVVPHMAATPRPWCGA